MKFDLTSGWRPLSGLALTAAACVGLFVPAVGEARLADVMWLLAALAGARTADKILARGGAAG